MSGYGNTPTTTTQGTLATNQFPIAEVYVPNTANGNLTALQGGPSSTDGLSNTSAPVATYTADGSNVTQGTSTDANTANTVMGRLTKIRDLLNGTLLISGAVTEANSTAILADLATLAGAISTGRMLITPPANTNVTEANSTAILADLATLAGAVSSSKMATKAAANDIVDLATLLTLAGTPTDANTVNSLMGRLTKIRDVLNGNVGVNVDQVNGATLSITNPLLSQHPKTAQVFAGNTYSMTSSKFFSSAGNNGFTMFNNSTAKTIVIRSIQAFDATNPPYFHLMKITSYTAFSDAITPVNHLFNGAASAIADHCSASINNAFSTVTGTEMRCLSQLTSGTLEMLNEGSPIILPANAANGIVLYTNTGAGGNNLGFTVEWDER